MAVYQITITATKGADPSGNNLAVVAIFDDGSDQPGDGQGALNGSGGYNPVVVTTPDLTGSEQVWIELVELDTGFTAIKVNLIGPYLLSDIGTVVT